MLKQIHFGTEQVISNIKINSTIILLYNIAIWNDSNALVSFSLQIIFYYNYLLLLLLISSININISLLNFTILNMNNKYCGLNSKNIYILCCVYTYLYKI